MPGTPHAPQTLFSGEIKESPRVREDTGLILTSFLQRLSFDLEKVLFSTARTHALCARVPGDNQPFHFHFMAKTLLEDEIGQPFPDADAALRHAKILAAQLSAGGHLVGCTILVAQDDNILFEVPLPGSMH